MDKPKRVAKYKSNIKVLDNGNLRGVCSCGWVQDGSVVQRSGLAEAMATVQSEIQAHKHIPKPKKEKKRANH